MNPIIVNSTNVINFGFTTVFKLYEKSIVFDISTLTSFKTGGAANVAGVYFQLIDPTGILVKDFDYTTPDILPSSASAYTFVIPSSKFIFGWWQINVNLKDADGTLYPIALKKNICMPIGLLDNRSIEGIMQYIVDCNSPGVTVTEQTLLTYNGKPPLSVSKSGTFYYPQGTIDPFNFDFTPVSISGAGQIYSGDYLVKNLTIADYDIGDSVSVEIKYFTTLKFSVACNEKLSNIMCCIEDIKSIYDEAPQSERGLDAKDKLQRASIPLYVAFVKEKSGQDASLEIKQIKDILNCECNCNPVNLEPAILGQGGSENIIQIQQGGAVTVAQTTSGSTTNYLISTKLIQLAKSDVNDLSFSLTKVESQYGIVYSIGFDYEALSTTILNTIAGDQDLVNLLNSIITPTGTNISLDGLVGGCVISLGNCNYLLQEPNNAVKTIVSITIGGTVYNAPSALLLTNTTGIATWLNGLNKGTFAVSLDSGSNTVSIVSNSNPNAITAFIFTSGGTNTTRLFTRSCVTLVEFLNAIVTYVCAITSLQVAYGITGDHICSFDGDGNLQTLSVDPSTEVGDVISEILAAQCQLFNKINGTALTCASLKALFAISTQSLVADDGVLGTKNDACAKILFSDLANILMTAIAGSPTLATQFCAIVASCSAPSCSAPSSVSGVLTIGPNCVPITNITGSVS